MPFSFLPLWNTLNKHNIGKYDLCQKLGLSSSTMAKMTNSQKVSLDVIARICDYFDCGLDDVVQYHSELDLFVQRIKKNAIECSYTVHMDTFPEYHILLSDYQLERLQKVGNAMILQKISECEKIAITKHKVNPPVLGTTAYAIQSSGNLLILKGAVIVAEIFWDWLLEQMD